MKLLILDDHPSIFLVIESLLKEIFPDIELNYFQDCQSASKSIEKSPPNFVISDIQIENIKQVEIPRLCHENGIPYMIFSSYINNTVLDLCNELKAMCVVSKSASIYDITQGLKALLSKNHYRCEVCSNIKKSRTYKSDTIPQVLFTVSEEYVIKAQLEGKTTIELSNESKKSKFTIRNQRMNLMEKNQCTMEEIARRYLFWHTKG
jgi:DNA-binding NarL/FixJ family response regulator